MISVVVGQGPHVVQPIERINGKFVVFSEGNLVSNQGPSTGLPAATQDGIIALLHFKAVGDRVAVRRVDLRADLGAAGATTSSCRRSRRRAASCAPRTTARSGCVGKGKGFGPEY